MTMAMAMATASVTPSALSNISVTTDINELFGEAERNKSVEGYQLVLCHPSTDRTPLQLSVNRIVLEEAIKFKEAAIQRSAELLRDGGLWIELDQFVRGLEGFWSTLARAKTARLVRFLLDCFDQMANAHRSSS